MPGYDANQFSPPAPVAQVTVRNPANAKTVASIQMLLDSGADVTLLPQSVADEVGVEVAAGQTYDLMGFDGSISRAQVARLDMILLGRTFRGQFLLIDQEWGIVGRDVLNLLALVLDGPQLTWGLRK